MSAKVKALYLTLPGSEAMAELLPEHGGILNRLRLDAGQGAADVIDGVQDLETLANNTWYRGAHLFPFPNRLADGKYQFAGHDYQFPINDPEHAAALHGFLSQMNPNSISQEGDNHVRWQFDYEGSYRYYPFPAKVVIDYRLESESELSVRFTVSNTGNTDCPIGIGWHPYFTLGQTLDDVEIYLPAVQRVQVDARLLPTGVKGRYGDSSLRPLGSTHLDDCFEFIDTPGISRVQLWLAKQQYGLEIWQESTSRFVQLFTHPDRQSIAIEPMSCNINAFNSGEGLHSLNPNESFSTGFGVKLITTLETI